MLGFFHQRIGERVHSLQERSTLVGGERREGVGERAVAVGEPFAHVRGGFVVEPQHRAPPVVRVLAAHEEAGRLEVARQLARSRQREADGLRDVADGRAVGSRDEGEDADVPASEAGLERRPAPPDTAQHPPQRLPELCDLVRWNTCHLVKVT